MPGQTNNTDLVAGANNIIVALNDLRASLVSQGGVGSEVSDLVELIADNIEALRADLVAQDVAAITAQNTNFSDLSTSLANLKLICQSITKVTVNNHFNPLTPPSTNGGSAIPPPEPFELIDEEGGVIQNRKCFIATAIVDECREWLDFWDGLYLDELLNVSLILSMSSWVAALAASATEGTLLATVLATSEGLLSKLVSYAHQEAGNVEFSDISASLVTNRDDLICALYEADTSDQARSDFIAVLSGAGMSLVNQGFVTVLLDYTALNYLFYYNDPFIEQEYLAATGYDCSGCGGTCANRLGTNGPGSTLGANSATIVSVQTGGDNKHYVSIWFDVTESFSFCGGTVDITNVQTMSGSIQPPAPPALYRIYDKQPTPGSSGNLYHSNNPPPTTIEGARYMVIKSDTAFTVQIDWV